MTATIALLGQPVLHSISPYFQQAALDSFGIDAQYESWDTSPEDLPVTIERLRSGDVMGANVTVPHKVEVMRLVDRLDPLAELVGAANTITRHNGRLHATNTDVAGLMGALSEAGMDVSGRRIVLIGAGGAARAVVVAMRQGGAESVTISNRTPQRGDSLISLGGEELFVTATLLDPSSEELKTAMESADLVLHSTPIGMRHGPDEETSLIPAQLFHPGQVAMDLVYVPEHTPFLKEAKKGGAHTIGGLGMLVHQGAESFRLWTGYEPPMDVMFEAARAALNDSHERTSLK